MTDEPRLSEGPTPRLQAPVEGGLHDRRVLNRSILALAVLSAVLIGLDPLVEKHPYFEVEHHLGFYGMIGAAAAAVFVLAARLLRPLLMRPEESHDR